VIFAAVSSAPQAVEEKASIPTQVANARALIQQRGWTETTPPLIVSGQSRHIDFLIEATEDIPAIDQLIKLARTNTIDLVVIRDYDRLARTRSLLTQISSYLNRCMVQIYALNKPVEPLPPEELARNGGRLLTSATVEAFASIEAEREIDRLRQRNRFGKGKLAQRGLWKHAVPTYGYTREVHTQDGTIYLDVPRVVEDQAAVIHRIERLYLEDGMGMATISQTLNLEGVPSQRRKSWTPGAVGRILHNPFYCGYIVWGLNRRQKVYDAEKQRFATKSIPLPSYKQMKSRLRRAPNLQDILDNQEALTTDGATIAKGQHQPIRTEERQHQIDREIEARIKGGGRGSSLHAKIPRLFTGLLVCSECGKVLTPTTNRLHHIYYACRGVRNGTCTNNLSIREDRLYLSVVDIIKQIAANPIAVDQYLDNQADQDTAIIEEEIANTTRGIAALEGRRARWDDAYENGVIELQDYSDKLVALKEEASRMEMLLTTLQQRLAVRRARKEQRARVIASVDKLPEITSDNKAQIKQQLRLLIKHIVIKDGTMDEIAFDV